MSIHLQGQVKFGKSDIEINIANLLNTKKSLDQNHNVDTRVINSTVDLLQDLSNEMSEDTNFIDCELYGNRQEVQNIIGGLITLWESIKHRENLQCITDTVDSLYEVFEL